MSIFTFPLYLHTPNPLKGKKGIIAYLYGKSSLHIRMIGRRIGWDSPVQYVC